jgi:hypothetical protein
MPGFFSSDLFLIATVPVAVGWGYLLYRLTARWAPASSWRRTVALAGLIGIGSIVAIGEVDALLRAMHPPGVVGSGLLDLFGFSDRPYRGVDTWTRWYVAAQVDANVSLLHPITVVEWNVFADTVLLVPAYAVFFGVLARRTWSALGQSSRRQAATAIGIGTEAFGSARRAARLSLIAISLAPVFDTTENGLALAFASRRIDVLIEGGVDPCVAQPPCPTNVPAGWLGPSMSIATALKLLSLVLGVALLLPSILLWLRLHADSAKRIGRTVRRLGAVIVVLVGFVLLMQFNPQTEDLLRGRSGYELLIDLVFLVVLILVTWWLSRRITHATPGTSRISWKAMAAGAIVLLILGATGLGSWPGPRGLLIAAVLLGAFALLERVSPSTRAEGAQEALEGIEVVPVVIALSYVILAGIFESQAILGATMFDRLGGFFLIVWTLGLTVVAPSVASVWAYRWLLDEAADDDPPRWLPTRLEGFHPAARVLLGAGLLIWAAVIVSPWAVSDAFGAVALVLVFFTLVTALVGSLSVYVERHPPPAALRAFGMRRIPVFALLVVWLLVPILWGLAGKTDYHDVRFMPATERASAFLALDSEANLQLAWERWLGQQPELQEPSVGARRVVPLVLVSAEGGGIKAAVWTSLALDCGLSEQPVGEHCSPHEGPKLRNVFAASGVSGGSLGLVTYVTKESAAPAMEPGEDWVKEILDHDYVSASLAWQMFVELPRAWLQFDVPMDRAEVLERAWERPWPNDELSAGFVEQYVGDPSVPTLLLNGYSVTDGCKFVTAPLDGNGRELSSGNCTHVRPRLGLDAEVERADRANAFLAGSRALPDLLCGDALDVRLSTAALLSARFPYVSPSALFHGCPDPDRRIQVADGGYLEGTGTGTILDLWTHLRPLVDAYNGQEGAPACIVPVLFQIGTGYGPTPDRADRRVDEGVVPVRGILNVPSGVGTWQVNQAEQAMLQELPGTGGQRGIYLRVAPVAHPGVQAPLGWSLSDTAYGDLVRQLSAASNQQSFADLDALLSGGSCG